MQENNKLDFNFDIPNIDIDFSELDEVLNIDFDLEELDINFEPLDFILSDFNFDIDI